MDTNLTKWLSVKVLFQRENRKTHTLYDDDEHIIKARQRE